ncbi:hypothetical protein LTS18_003251 [Coniosporium uncinatum]|uniref:Uncharacterized protein n=2 Tax=Coniosporium uncinatum TaxID=93489 RepID=A0ACC3D6Z8_9PEZI|nr:hypothetical protein LTS18_003251 [Coniosporium uncinatum]
MGVAKRTRKFAQVKRVIGQRDARLKKNQLKGEEEAKKQKKENEVIREIPQVASNLFFQYNTALVPPYSVLVDTNFLSHRIALRIARDERWERMKCDHKGTYADDCIVDTVMRHKVFIVATNDKELKRRIRKIPGVPLMSVARGKYTIERLPDAPEK